MGPGARTLALALVGACFGCVSQSARLPIHGDARDQIWLAKASQVKVRAAQSRTLETHDRQRVLQAVLTTLQDLGFQIAVLDEVLGVVSAKKFVDLGDEGLGYDPFYSLYDDESLVAFTKTYRTWGPFRHREDLVRLTVTVRERNREQLIVRTSAQFCLRPVEDPEPYQKFFRSLEHALFTEQNLARD